MGKIGAGSFEHSSHIAAALFRLGLNSFCHRASVRIGRDLTGGIDQSGCGDICMGIRTDRGRRIVCIDLFHSDFLLWFSECILQYCR